MKYQLVRPISLSAPVIALAQLILVAGSAQAAAIVTTPLSLSPGAQYRPVFVTSQTRDAIPADIATYNSFVTGVANSQPLLASLGVSWTAIASTSTVDARDNTASNPNIVLGVPIYRLDGLQVANNNFSLWAGGYPMTSISITELGGTTPISSQTAGFDRPWVWTGSQDTGVKAAGTFYLGGGPFATAAVAYNSEFFNPNEWIGLASSASTDQHAFYAISDVITVSEVPEPLTAFVLAVGLVTVGVGRWRHK